MGANQTRDFTQEEGIPANIDAERTVLGAILLDNESFFHESVDLEYDDFILDSHRRIYLRMTEILFGMAEGATQVDIVTLANELNRNHEIEAVGGIAYIASLTEGLPRRPVIEEYVRIVKEKAKLRKMMVLFSQGQTKASDQAEKSEAISDWMQEQLLEVAADRSSQSSSIGQIDVESQIKARRNLSDQRTALDYTWGLKEIDDFTHGAFRGEFTVIGGEESSGKSSLLLQILLANAEEGTPCGLMSMEMSKPQVKQRCYPLLSEVITSNHVRDPRLMNPHTHLPEMARITKRLSQVPLHIDDTRQLRIDKLISRMRVMRRKLGCKVFGIDFLQLIKAMPKMNPLEGFTNIVLRLRDFPATMEPDCHIFALSQYSNEPGGFAKKKRSNQSLFGGSVIRYAAQNVVLLSVENTEKVDIKALLETEVKFSKQREGARGKVNCYYDREHYRFCQPQPVLR